MNYIMNNNMHLRVDTNDADLKSYKIKINEDDISHIRSVCDRLYNIELQHNYPSGRYKNIIPSGLHDIIFDKYIGKKTFHTIHYIDINDEILFVSNHWSNWKVVKLRPFIIDKLELTEQNKARMILFTT